jgi:thiol-disulfide isomerase/thioredoxin
VKKPALIMAGLAAVAGLAVFVVVLTTNVSDEGVRMELPSAAACSGNAPDCLPKFTLLDTDGRKWPPDELAGKVVVFNVWATWCEPCKQEIPDLAGLHSTYAKNGLALFGLLAEYNVTGPQVREFAHANGINYPIVFMEPELAEALKNPSRLPTTFVYDRHGKRRGQYEGVINREEMAKTIDQLLAEK